MKYLSNTSSREYAPAHIERMQKRYSYQAGRAFSDELVKQATTKFELVDAERNLYRFKPEFMPEWDETGLRQLVWSWRGFPLLQDVHPFILQFSE